MKLKDITLLVLDEPNNFFDSNTQLRIGKDLYKDVELIQNREDFDKQIRRLENDHQFILICHVFHATTHDQIRHKGYHKLKGTGIEDDYNIEAILVSSADSGDVMKNIYSIEKDERKVYSYSKIRENLKGGIIKPYTKQAIIKEDLPLTGALDLASKENLQVDYAIITALYNDEFEEIDKLFNWIETKQTLTTSFKFGHLKENSNINVVASIQNETGMVDAAILATIILETYRPKYLLMPGVCGGIPGLPLGSIIIASGVFTFQKGKISDLKDQDGRKLNEYYDKNTNEVDLNQIFDKNHKPVKVFIEKFEIESDLIRIDSLVKSKIEPYIKKIKEKINEPYMLTGQEIDIVFEKLACSTMVINKEDYFDDNIKPLDRKTAGVEMESYGIARACQLANDGKTKFVIFKAVMDNMKNKTDNGKPYAAFTSAQFLKYILFDNVLN